MPFPGRVQRGIRSHSQLWHRNAVRVHDHGLRVAQFDADAHYAEHASLAERRRGRDVYMTPFRRGLWTGCDALVHDRRLQERGQQGHTTCIEDEANCLLGTFGILTVQELPGTPQHRVWALNTPESVRPRYMAYIRSKRPHDNPARCCPRRRIYYRLDIGAPAPSRSARGYLCTACRGAATRDRGLPLGDSDGTGRLGGTSGTRAVRLAMRLQLNIRG